MSVELDILNAMLEAIGSSSISSTVGRHPGLLRAQPILARNNRTFQARGHWFNTDWSLPILPDEDGEFILPQSTLKADTTNKRLPYVRRGLRMYDPRNHTFQIDTNEICVDCVVQLDYEDLPEHAIALIRATSVWQIVQVSNSDAITLNARQRELAQANRDFERERVSQADTSLRDNPNYRRIMGGLLDRHHRGTYPQYIGG